VPLHAITDDTIIVVNGMEMQHRDAVLANFVRPDSRDTLVAPAPVQQQSVHEVAPQADDPVCND